MKRLTILLILEILLVACNAPRPVNTPTALLNANPAPISTSTPTKIPTDTPTLIPSPSPSPSPTPAYPQEGYGPSDFPPNINPLTGLSVTNASLLQRRPLAIKVNIVPRTSTRPPWGITLADIVYDFYHNAGYTRFHAIYYGQDAELVGPIRSARFPDDALVQMYHSIFAYGGADYRINARLLYSDYSDRLVLEGRMNLCPPTPEFPMCRHDPNGYDFLLGGTEQIHEYIAAQGVNDSPQDLDGMLFRMNLPPGGKAGEVITTHYSIDTYNRWKYDPQTGTYLRYQDNLLLDQGQEEEFVPLMDQLTENQVSANNVVVLMVPHSYYLKSPEIIEINFTGSGPAYAFRDGMVYEVQWNHPNPEGVLYLTLPDGSRYPFKPGNTWFQVVGQYSFVTQPAPNEWRFMFQIP
ncbi:MAG: DUF3048 domain-containing protein [Anaerolineales bacterium]|jgi:hypothetical protein